MTTGLQTPGQRREQTHAATRPGLIQSLDRGIDVLRLITDAGRPVPVREIAQALSLNTSTASRLAATLRERGLLAQEKAGGPYTLGLELLRYAGAALRENTLVSAGRPVLESLLHQLDETVSLSIPTAEGVLYVLSMTPAERIVRITISVGSVFPYSATAAGKAMLAHFPESRMNVVLVTPLPRLTPNSIVDAKRLRRELHTVVDAGYALNRGESDLALGCVAVPVLDGEGQPLAAVSCSVTLNSLDDRKLAGLIGPLQLAASSIAAGLPR